MSQLAPAPLSLSIRPAQEADIPTLRTLAERIWRHSYAEMLTLAQIDYMLGWMYAPAQISAELRAGVVWKMAWLNDEPIGFSAVSRQADGRAKLDKLYLAPEEQGRGRGAALLQDAEATAQRLGAREIWLQVNRKNTLAQRLYERAGYVLDRAVVTDIGGGFVMDDFILRRELPAPAAV